MTKITDVAKKAGVASSTVSRALSGKKVVSEKVRKRVFAAAAELKYHPNSLAKGLKMGHTNTVALLVPSLENEIYPEVTQGVEDTARKHGFTVILCNTSEDPDIEKEYIRKMRLQWIDGFIVCSMLKSAAHIRELAKEGFPVVLALRHYDDSYIDTVAIDNKSAAYQATGYLISRGHRKIALGMGRDDLKLYHDRMLGYKEALRDAGIGYDEELVIREDRGSITELAGKLIRSAKRPDAFFATNDPKAYMIMHAIYDAGLRIPEDISVMGFDNVSMSSLTNPPLSTMSQPMYDIGVHAMEKLLRQIGTKREGTEYQPSLELLPTELVIRKSVR